MCTYNSFLISTVCYMCEGAGYITFWKIVQTFTGLKLQGTKGQFGTVDFSDIIGVYAMPDEKVDYYSNLVYLYL